MSRKKEAEDWGKVSEMEGPQKPGRELEAPPQRPCPEATRRLLTRPPGQPFLLPVVAPRHHASSLLPVCVCVCPLPWVVHTAMQ